MFRINYKIPKLSVFKENDIAQIYMYVYVVCLTWKRDKFCFVLLPVPKLQTLPNEINLFYYNSMLLWMW